MAHGGPKARRYAQALFQLATEQGKGEAWLGTLRHASEAIEEPIVAFYLGIPQVPLARKLETVAQVMADADPLLINAVSLLTRRRSLGVLPDVVRVYAELLNESEGRTQARVTSAIALSDAQQGRLSSLLGDMLNKEVVLDISLDEDIIGGIIVQVGDQIIDGSVKSRLQALKQQLEREQVTG